MARLRLDSTPHDDRIPEPRQHALTKSTSIPREQRSKTSNDSSNSVPKTDSDALKNKIRIRRRSPVGALRERSVNEEHVKEDTINPHPSADKPQGSKGRRQQLSNKSLESKPEGVNTASLNETDDTIEEVEIEESICDDSNEESHNSSDDELPDVWGYGRSRKNRPVQRSRNLHTQRLPDIAKRLQAMSLFDREKPEERQKTGISKPKEQNPVKSTIRFSPPRTKQTSNPKESTRPATPPSIDPPPKSRLQSPSKRAPRLPTPPHRPSLDAFWAADAVNDWNDQHSPQKPLKSPRKLFRPESEEASPTTSPSKLQSPTKRTKAEIDSRKDFEARKVALAESFLQDLDQTITQGKIQELAAPTGGVKITWSKTLNSTAGRANWRRETTRVTNTKNPKADIKVTHKHFASIELATKVIDCEDRLFNVIAHEFCHLCNFMISGIKDQPHGRQFKEWGKLCTKAFGNRGVEVTTKHSYEIEYKYIWQCGNEDCGLLFKRHSKSIDPSKHRCGSCKAGLMQIKPVPRKGAAQCAAKLGVSAKAAPVTGYAAFVKEHFAPLKKSMPGASHKEVMEALGKKYREDKARAAAPSPELGSLAEAVARDLEKMKLGESVVEPVFIDSD